LASTFNGTNASRQRVNLQKQIIKMKDDNVKNVKRQETEQVAFQSVVGESNRPTTVEQFSFFCDA